MDTGFVAYYRVSKQGKSKELSLQKKAVEKHFAGAELPAHSFIEEVSGSQKTGPVISEAVAYCKRKRATLVVAKIGRLSRNLSFIEALGDDIDFVCCDMPQATRKTIGVIVDMARWERKQRAKRIKESLAIKRKAGALLGANHPKVKAGLLKWRQNKVLEKINEAEDKAKNRATALKAQKPTKRELADQRIVPSLKILIKSGYSYKRIAYAFNLSTPRTRQGKKWSAAQVFRVVKRNNLNKGES